MAQHLGLKSWATGALVLAAVTACTDADRDPPPSQSPPPLSSSPTSASPTSPADAASAEAAVLVERYFAAVDEARMKPSTPLKALRSVATGSQLRAQTTLIRQERADGLRQTGRSTVVVVEVQSVDLDDSAPDHGKAPTVVVDVCWDVSAVDIRDADGKSVVSASRPDRGWTRYTLANYIWTDDPSGGWRVASGQDLEKTPCPAS